MERVYTLRDMGFTPYVMLYDKENIPKGHKLRHLQRWVNNRIIFRTVRNFEEYQKIEEYIDKMRSLSRRSILLAINKKKFSFEIFKKEIEN